MYYGSSRWWMAWLGVLAVGGGGCTRADVPGEPPVIASVRGNGPKQDDGSTAVMNGIVIVGDRLGRPGENVVWLRRPDGTETQLETSKASTAERIEAELPDDFAPGRFALGVTTGGLSAEAAVEILRGEAGPTGLAGPTGPEGPAGPAGPAGPIGSSGEVGPTGPIGPMGPAGPTGPTGSSGEMGLTGPLGPTGLDGPAGPTGPAGTAGETGPAGPIGPTGPVGPKGDPGSVPPSLEFVGAAFGIDPVATGPVAHSPSGKDYYSVLNGTAELLDTHDALSPFSGLFTAPLPGIYEVSAELVLDGAAGAHEGQVDLTLRTGNGVVKWQSLSHAATGETAERIAVKGVFPPFELQSDDEVLMTVFQATGVPRAIVFGHVYFKRVAPLPD